MPPSDFFHAQRSASPNDRTTNIWRLSNRSISKIRQLFDLYRYWVRNFISACKPRSRRTLCLTSILLAIWIATPVLALGSDYGDAPTDLSSIDAALTNIYGSASHQTDDVTYLGTLVDSEPNNQPTSNADGDDNNGSPNDEDGVTFPLVGSTRVLNVGSLNNLTIKASTTGKLNAWIDWNQDGDWTDTEEQIAVNQDLMVGNNSLAVTVPDTAPHGATYARFRFSTASGLGATGDTSNNGEVEDYKVNIALPGITVCSTGLLNGGFELPNIPSIKSGSSIIQSFDADRIIIYRENDVPSWGTIANNPSAAGSFDQRNGIELWKEGQTASPVITHPFEGNQFAEINAYTAGRLYQDFTVLAGTEIRWQVAHRGRQGNDTMAVYLGAPDASDATTQQGSDRTTPNTEWRVYSGVYQVPSGQDVTRFALKAVGGTDGLGNLVDDVRLTLRCSPTVNGYKSVKLTTDANSNSKINPGDIVTYSLYYANTGQGPAAGFQINDPLPLGVTLNTPGISVTTFQNGTATTSTASKNSAYTGVAGAASNLLSPGALLDADKVIRVDIPVTINANTLSGTLINQGTATANDFPGLILTDNIDSTSTGLGITIPTGSVPQLKQSSIDPTSIQVINSTATGNVLLVKRITAIHDNNTINPNDNTPLHDIVNDSTATNNPYWPSDYLYGAAAAGQVKSGDSIEYTVYFLNTGPSDAKSLRICDLLTANQVFKNGSYGGVGKDIQIQIGTGTVQDLTAINDPIDRARVHPPGATTVPSTCYISPLPNPNSSIVDISVTGTIGDPSIPTLTVIPKSTSPAATPNNSYGLVRFKTTVP